MRTSSSSIRTLLDTVVRNTTASSVYARAAASRGLRQLSCRSIATPHSDYSIDTILSLCTSRRRILRRYQSRPTPAPYSSRATIPARMISTATVTYALAARRETSPVCAAARPRRPTDGRATRARQSGTSADARAMTAQSTSTSSSSSTDGRHRRPSVVELYVRRGVRGSAERSSRRDCVDVLVDHATVSVRPIGRQIGHGRTRPKKRR